MKKFIQKIINGLPYVVLVALAAIVVSFVSKRDFQYNEMIGLIKVLIWPAIVLSALVFFRKVFTYLFFSMEEFNFFGNRGVLKNIQEVIDERVQRKFKEKKKEEEDRAVFDKIKGELEVAKQSKQTSVDRARENLELAKEIFKEYKKSTDEKNKVMEELVVLRREKAERESRIAMMRERARKRREELRHEHSEPSPSPEEIDAAGEAYIQQETDKEKGK